jgi:hypothetical protein
MAAPEPETVQLPLLLEGADQVPILHSNVFLSQEHQNEFFVTFGQVSPPILLGTPEQQRKQAQELSYVSAKVIFRLALSRARLKELIDVLQKQLDLYDAKR